jgi:hypothetical protein
MPCFKGIAVSVHANGNPLPEYGIQKQSRLSRISSYIPVPQPTLDDSRNKPEPAKFAISITLLTPGLPIPYSTPKPTEVNPLPKPELVGHPPSSEYARNSTPGIIAPYIPMTNSENETIAAYIYFDGRVKEEVATLLRPGEETWVNSRWVQVSNAEGGGLAEREFIFREVGLEKWLNGLDLYGHDVNVAERLEKRREKFERRRRRQALMRQSGEGIGTIDVTSGYPRDTLRYGADTISPLEVVEQADSESDSDGDEPPEATGQIKVAMFRVLASGEIKKGEYSPQFDAHDDDDLESGSGTNQAEVDVEHTTSFAKPKSLDPKTISTQTVTGIDGPDKPFATFTFFYRGESRYLQIDAMILCHLAFQYKAKGMILTSFTGQLQKIGVVTSSKQNQPTTSAFKRRSGQLDLSHLGPLRTRGTVGFTSFRDKNNEQARRAKARKRDDGNMGITLALNDDSEDDDGENDFMAKIHGADDRGLAQEAVAPEDVRSQGELAAGVDRIRVRTMIMEP